LHKIKVDFFQRRPRPGFSFSIEHIFDDVRRRLADRIEASVHISPCYNDGYFTKLVNIVSAGFKQGKSVTHITGEVHFLNLLMRKQRTILTIHDCGMMARKTGPAKKLVQWLYLTGPVKKAAVVTTVSEATKQQVIAYTRVNPDKVVVIPVAVNAMFQPSPKAFNKQKPVILQIGTSYNKNLEKVIAALAGVPCHLSIIGQLSADQLTALETHHIDYGNEYNITDERLLEKYQQCDLLLFASTAEGFGMPIIEANAVEKPVVTSNLSSMPEVAGNAACLVDPFDVDDIRRGILEVINNDAYREELISCGRLNKLRFDGNKVARSYYSLYEQLDNK